MNLDLTTNFRRVSFNAADYDSGSLSDYWQPQVQNWYPKYAQYWGTESKLEKAFILVQKLIDLKIIKEPKMVKDFVELVNVLAEEL